MDLLLPVIPRQNHSLQQLDEGRRTAGIHDWFEHLFGFKEEEYLITRDQFDYADETLISRINGRHFQAGSFNTPSIAMLRENASRWFGESTIRHEVVDDVLLLHADPANSLDMFQVASQFNALEFPSPDARPEDGITGYASDPTQGPACSLAAAAGTVFRNYFINLETQIGQTESKQLNNLEALELSLTEGPYWKVRNGYVESDTESLDSFDAEVSSRSWDDLVGAVKIGLQARTEVVFRNRFSQLTSPHLVNQAFCAAVSCAYNNCPTESWKNLAQVALDAAYEGTLLAAAIQRDAGVGSGRVWLTLIGGGAFGNEDEWIYSAMKRALTKVTNLKLDIRICHYRELKDHFTDL